MLLARFLLRCRLSCGHTLQMMHTALFSQTLFSLACVPVQSVLMKNERLSLLFVGVISELDDSPLDTFPVLL